VFSLPRHVSRPKHPFFVQTRTFGGRKIAQKGVLFDPSGGVQKRAFLPPSGPPLKGGSKKGPKKAPKCANHPKSPKCNFMCDLEGVVLTSRFYPKTLCFVRNLHAFWAQTWQNQGNLASKRVTRPSITAVEAINPLLANNLRLYLVYRLLRPQRNFR
jgi:hypothetical protein